VIKKMLWKGERGGKREGGKGETLLLLLLLSDIMFLILLHS